MNEERKRTCQLKAAARLAINRNSPDLKPFLYWICCFGSSAETVVFGVWLDWD